MYFLYFEFLYYYFSSFIYPPKTSYFTDQHEGTVFVVSSNFKYVFFLHLVTSCVELDLKG